MDPVRLNLVTRALESIPAEMSINMLKAAYSSIVREAKDFATNLFDCHGRSVTQSEQIPILVAALGTALRFVIEKHPLESWKHGELVITNDPYHGGQHLNDIALFMPIFVDGERVGIAGAIAHHLDLGGITPGIIGSATEVFHDGMLFPRIKFAMHDGKLDPVLEEMIRANTRVPDETVGDLHAQIVALRTAEARLGTIFGKFGRRDVLDVMSRLQDYAESLTRQEIGSFPDGESAGEAIVDDDSQGNGPFTVRAKVAIRGTELHVDFSGTDAQARGTINCPFASTLAATYTAIRQVVNTRVTVPANDGSTRPITVTAPRGSLVNPLPAGQRARAFHHRLPLLRGGDGRPRQGGPGANDRGRLQLHVLLRVRGPSGGGLPNHVGDDGRRLGGGPAQRRRRRPAASPVELLQRTGRVGGAPVPLPAGQTGTKSCRTRAGTAASVADSGS